MTPHMPASADGEAMLLTTRRGTATFKARLTRTIREDTVLVPFHWSGERRPTV